MICSRHTKKILALGFCGSLYAVCSFAHGVLEFPPSRQQFCGVESKPDEIFRDKMTHEQCRPMMTKADGSMDNSIYNFMAVLTHTTGRQGLATDKLPKYVCGFNSENWNKSETPWDKAIDWPTSQIVTDSQKFVWNINWGNHFGDTEEFVYWITKSDFKFDSTKQLTWNDFEATPFCVLKYNDSTPNANPNIIPDKPNNKFTTVCSVPYRANRAVIYAEWGRNKNTYERFHTCADVTFASDSPGPIAPTASIQALPSKITGATEVALDGSQSAGENLTYQWSIQANNTAPYQLQNPDSAQALLVLADVAAEQQVTVNLTVSQNGLTASTSQQFLHYPGYSAVWKDVGLATTATSLAAGDEIWLRLIDQQGKDYSLPSTHLVLTAATAQDNAWAFALAQQINNSNAFGAKIGVLSADRVNVSPVQSANANKIYVPADSLISNGYITVKKQTVPPSGNCSVRRKSGSSSYWLGYDVYASATPIILDFSATGIDLTKVNVDRGVFPDAQVISKTQLKITKKPDWVSMINPGYLGFNASNYAPLNSTTPAICTAGG